MSLETGFFPLQGLSQFANSFMTFSKMKRSSEEKRRKSASAGKARSATAGFKVFKGGKPPVSSNIHSVYIKSDCGMPQKRIAVYCNSSIFE